MNFTKLNEIYQNINKNAKPNLAIMNQKAFEYLNWYNSLNRFQKFYYKIRAYILDTYDRIKEFINNE